MRMNRRDVMRALFAVPVAGALGRPLLAATPECAGDEPTPSAGAGPYFKPDSPLRASLLEAGLDGPRLVVGGRVLTTACQPVPRALLDFWQADGDGQYDVGGFRLRGHQFADDSGRFRLETIVPAAYGGRTRHIHVRVQAPAGRVLTTQLFFPDEPANGRRLPVHAPAAHANERRHAAAGLVRLRPARLSTTTTALPAGRRTRRPRARTRQRP
jgi:protocatechuate 3,4-dioxygenase beta subunit